MKMSAMNFFEVCRDDIVGVYEGDVVVHGQRRENDVGEFSLAAVLPHQIYDYRTKEFFNLVLT